MIAKNNRLNHDFQILFFLVAKTHTPDAAYALLKDLQQDREMALDKARSSVIRHKAKLLDIERRLKSDDEVERLEAEADKLDFENEQRIFELNVKAAERELNFINKLIDLIQPYRKYTHLPDHEAFELCQSEEWYGELLDRARNQILLTGTVNPEDFSNILVHPNAQQLLNEVTKLIEYSKLPGGYEYILKNLVKPKFVIEIENKLSLTYNNEEIKELANESKTD